MMNEKEFMKVAGPAMSDETLLPVTIPIKEAWLLVSGLQLAARHPRISLPMRRTLIAIARQFQQAIEEIHPEAHEALEMGWNTKHDR